MFSIEYLQSSLGQNNFKTNDDLSVVQIKKRFNSPEQKLFVASLKDPIGSIVKLIKEGYNMVPSLIPDENIEDLRHEKYTIIQDDNKYLKYIEKKEFSENLEGVEECNIQDISTEIKQIISENKKYIEYIFTKQTSSLNKLLKYGNNLLKCYKVSGNIVIAMTVKENTYVYCSTLPLDKLQKLFQRSYGRIYLGVFSDDTNPVTVINLENPTNIRILKNYLYIAIKDSKKSIFEKPIDYSKLESPYPLHNLLEMCYPYSYKVARGTMQNSLYDLAKDCINYEQCIKVYKDDKMLLFIDLVSRHCLYGFSKTSDINIANTEIVNKCSELKVSVWIAIPITKAESDTSSAYIEYEHNITSNDISGSKNRKVRETVNKINKTNCIIIKTEDNPKDIERTIKDHILPIKKIWAKDWSSRHKDTTGIDGIVLSVVYEDFITYMYSFFSDLFKEKIKCALISFYKQDGTCVGFALSTQETDKYVYHQENGFIKDDSIPNHLRQVSSIKETEYWLEKLGNEAIVNSGVTKLIGLKEFKSRCRPFRISKLKMIRN